MSKTLIPKITKAVFPVGGLLDFFGRAGLHCPIASAFVGAVGILANGRTSLPLICPVLLLVGDYTATVILNH